MFEVDAKILTCKEVTFSDGTKMFKVCIIVNGEVATVHTRKPYVVDTVPEFEIYAGYNGKLAVRLK